jgi:hypothetical protein
VRDCFCLQTTADQSSQDDSANMGSLLGLLAHGISIGGSSEIVEQRVKLLLVCGPWSSGTTAVAGLLAKLGVIGLDPYFTTNDQRTRNTYESIAFREVIRSVASEETLTLRPRIDVIGHLREFHDRILKQEFGRGDGPIFLKYPLSALVIPQICEVFETRLIYVLRPLLDIEATRRRRAWLEQFGAKGADIIYTAMFNALINYPFPTTVIRYPELIVSPVAHVRQIVDFAELKVGQNRIREASHFIRKSSTPADSH